jgi:hypothetical protein
MKTDMPRKQPFWGRDHFFTSLRPITTDKNAFPCGLTTERGLPTAGLCCGSEGASSCTDDVITCCAAKWQLDKTASAMRVPGPDGGSIIFGANAESGILSIADGTAPLDFGKGYGSTTRYGGRLAMPCRCGDDPEVQCGPRLDKMGCFKTQSKFAIVAKIPYLWWLVGIKDVEKYRPTVQATLTGAVLLRAEILLMFANGDWMSWHLQQPFIFHRTDGSSPARDD